MESTGGHQKHSFIFEDPNEQKQCRVCFEPVPLNEVRSYCQCRGNLKCIHFQCILQWAKRAQQLTDRYGHSYFLCDICKEKIFLQIENHCRICTMDQMCVRIQKMICEVFFLLVLFMMFISATGVEIRLLEEPNLRFVMGIMLVFSVLVLGLVVTMFIYKVLLHFESEITDFRKIAEKEIKPGAVVNCTLESFDETI